MVLLSHKQKIIVHPLGQPRISVNLGWMRQRNLSSWSTGSMRRSYVRSSAWSHILRNARSVLEVGTALLFGAWFASPETFPDFDKHRLLIDGAFHRLRFPNKINY